MNYYKSSKVLIDEKMKVLEDFDICDRRDKEMRARLEQALADRPDVDKRRVLDYYCRPMIHAKVNSWQ